MNKESALTLNNNPENKNRLIISNDTIKLNTKNLMAQTIK